MLALKDVIQAGLVAGDAGVDLVGATLGRLVHEVGIGQQRRAIDTKSAWPLAMICSATSGVLMRLLAITGMPTSGRSLPVAQANAARGTEVTIVGTRASCQPMPVLRASAGALERLRELDDLIPALAAGHEIQEREAVDDQESSPTAARHCSTISIGRRMRFWALPPYSSVRWFVAAERNWLMKYPSEPMISMPS